MSRADVEPHPAVRDRVGGHRPRGRRPRRSGRRRRRRPAACSSQPRSAASATARRAVSWPSASSCRDAPTGWPCAARNVNAIAPPIRIASAGCGEAVDDADLVRHLDAAEHGDERVLRRVQQPPNASARASSSSPAAAGSRCATPSVEAWARWAAPNASLTYRSASAASSAANAGSLRVLRGSKRRFSSSRSGALPRRANATGSAQELGQPRRPRAQRQRRVGRALGPAEVRADDHAAPRARAGSWRVGQRGPDAGVVGDPAVLERHVEVGAHQHPRALATSAGRGRVLTPLVWIRSATRHE